VIIPAGLTFATLLALFSVNQTFRSGPPVMSEGTESADGMSYSLIVPTVVPLIVILPILFVAPSVNQMFPSGPEVMALAPALAVGIGNSVSRLLQVPESQ
jgi:hypothetical protein